MPTRHEEGGGLTLHTFLYGNPDVQQLSFDPEGVIGMPIAAAAPIAIKAAGRIKRLFHKGVHGLKRHLPKHGKAEALQGAITTAQGMGFLPGGAPAPPSGMMGPGGPGGPPGVHGHWTKAHGHVPSHWSNKRRPRMHATNPRALRRAMRRMESFGKLAHRYVQLSHHHHFRKKPLKRKAA